MLKILVLENLLGRFHCPSPKRKSFCAMIGKIGRARGNEDIISFDLKNMLGPEKFEENKLCHKT